MNSYLHLFVESIKIFTIWSGRIRSVQKKNPSLFWAFHFSTTQWNLLVSPTLHYSFSVSIRIFNRPVSADGQWNKSIVVHAVSDVHSKIVFLFLQLDSFWRFLDIVIPFLKKLIKKYFFHLIIRPLYIS